MADRATYRTEHGSEETAEMAFRRIARRKLLERGCPEDQVEQKLTELLRTGARLRIDVDAILGQAGG